MLPAPPPRPRPGLVALVLGALLLRGALAANWAQVNGENDQNVVAVTASPYVERWGHAIVSYDYSREEEIATGQNARIFILGGDQQSVGTAGSSYLNDVYATPGISWSTVLSSTQRTIYGEKMARILSGMDWYLTNAGSVPPNGVTYDEWLLCATRFWAPDDGPGGCTDPTSAYGRYVSDHIWSPRRNHAAVIFEGKITVLGGRARDLSDLEPEETVGGIEGPRLADFWREKTRLTNDVWTSDDEGVSWTLVSPGCREPQASLLKWGNDRDGHLGTPETECENDNDCWGTSTCVVHETSGHGACVCDMWSARERHSVTTFDGYMYVSGGFAAAHGQVCGPYACGDGVGSGYRVYMNDVWSSHDGVLWTMLTETAEFEGRGEHSMHVFLETLWVFGGRTAPAAAGEDPQFLNDVWYSASGFSWTRATTAAEWPARGNHVSVATEDAIVLFGGETEDGFVADVWSWDGLGTSEWVEDFGVNSSVVGYIHQDSAIEDMRTLNPTEVALLNAEGVYTISDFASADKYVILKMRGHDFPGNEPIVGFEDVCDHFYLAKALVDKCQTASVEYDGYWGFWANVVPQYGGADPDASDDGDGEITAWDGCAPISDPKPNVPALGEVTTVAAVRDPIKEQQMLPCRWVPKARAYHAGTYFDGKFYVFGGKTEDESGFLDDAWYRDSVVPATQLTTTPRTQTSDAMFKFEADEDGCIFEYMVMDVKENLQVRRWTKARHYVYVEHWMPGEGDFAMYVRAIDPAGNVDDVFEEGRNVHTWYFIPKPPVLVIVLSSIGAVLLCIVMGLQWRHRRKKAAMERYAIKRMRRRFRGIQQDVAKKEVDWKKYYEEHKNDAVETDESNMYASNRKRSVAGAGPVKSHQVGAGAGGKKKKKGKKGT